MDYPHNHLELSLLFYHLEGLAGALMMMAAFSLAVLVGAFYLWKSGARRICIAGVFLFSITTVFGVLSALGGTGSLLGIVPALPGILIIFASPFFLSAALFFKRIRGGAALVACLWLAGMAIFTARALVSPMCDSPCHYDEEGCSK